MRFSQWVFLFTISLLLHAGGHTAPVPDSKYSPFGPLTWTRIGNTPLSPNYFEFDDSALLHLTAVDFFQSAGTPVYSAHAGIVSLSTAPQLKGWTTTLQIIRQDGLMTYYMHLDPTSLPREFQFSPDGFPVAEGAFLGRLIPAPKYLSSHLHFGAGDCKRRVRINPLRLLKYRDTRPPVITAILAHAPGESSLPQASREITTVSGAVELTVFAYDLIDGMSGQYPPDRIEFEIISGNGTIVFRSVLFDSAEIPARDSRADTPCDLLDYDEYDRKTGSALYRLAFLYEDLANRPEGLPFALTADTTKLKPRMLSWLHPHPGPWKTSEVGTDGERIYPNGDYRVRVQAHDGAGNKSSFETTIRVHNPQ